MTAELTVNGALVAITGEHPHLLSALRDELNLTAAKDGCSPSGQCGCCTVIVDGKAVTSCQQPVAKLAGKSITTLEGVSDVERGRFALASSSFVVWANGHP